ncbi:MAG: helix-turn-helix domain-containing protein [Pseudobutyrivibrio sp.]|nr:helix-turn-helix domain-containing protein [Pseudobutyrivibrio sp.]
MHKIRFGFAHKLKQYRKAIGWTQSKLADLLETYPSTISRWEVGKHVPKKYLFHKMMLLFERNGYGYSEFGNVTLEDLIYAKQSLLRTMRDGEITDIIKTRNILLTMYERDDIEWYQYRIISEKLILYRRKIISSNEFLLTCEEIFEMQSGLPALERKDYAKRSQIEYSILYLMAETYAERDEYDVALYIFDGIYNSLRKRQNNDGFYKEHMMSACLHAVKIHIACHNSKKANELLNTVFMSGLDNFEMHSFVKGVELLRNICLKLEHETESDIISEYIDASGGLVDLLHYKYEVDMNI